MTVGTAVSAAFLLIIGAANFFILKGVWDSFGRVRRGERISDEDIDALLAGRGFIARIFRRLFRVVARSWHLYPIGFLFGLGVDTATEIGLLGISATQAAQGMSLWTILVSPALFTGGMSLMDTTDSVLMTRAYGWAFVHPIRKLWYNLTITGCLCRRRAFHRRHRGAWADCRQARSGRKLLERYRPGECGNGARVEPVRHRQTKGAATDMFSLQPPRHTPTYPIEPIPADIANGRCGA